MQLSLPDHTHRQQRAVQRANFVLTAQWIRLKSDPAFVCARRMPIAGKAAAGPPADLPLCFASVGATRV